MQTLLDTILRHVAQAETTAENDPQYIDFLDRVIMEAKSRRAVAAQRTFGAQFKQTEVAPAGEGDAPRVFAVDDKVRTKEGYIGHVAGYDKRGRVVVNVVWQACEYAEADLKPMEKHDAPK